MIAIVTPAYIQSKVCYEEYSLAMALHQERHQLSKKRFYFYPVIVGKTVELPDEFSHQNMLKCQRDEDSKQIIAEASKHLCLKLKVQEYRCYGKFR